jgi:hypothetical protein
MKKKLLFPARKNGKIPATIFLYLFSCFLFSTSSYAQCLSGTYTIGGSGANYPTFKNATDALLTNGVCGPVNFKIANGTYAGDIVVPKVTGTSTTNIITFESASGDSSKVIIKDTNQINLTIGCSNVIIKNIGFYRAYSTSNQSVLKLRDSVENITVTNCYFQTEGIVAIDFIYATLRLNLKIYNNSFQFLVNGFNPCSALKLHSSLQPHQYGTGIKIFKNVFKGFYTSMDIFRADSVLITENNIQTTSHSKGISIAECDNFRVSKNKISGEGISVSQCDLGGLALRLIENNFISGSMDNGIFIFASYNCKVYSNTINLTGGTSANNTSTGIHLINLSTADVENNIINASGNAQLLHVESSFQPDVIIDYNDYHTTNAVMFSLAEEHFETLNQWQQATGRDKHSLAFAPQFVSATDFHLQDYNLANKGTPTIVTEDIDGESRGSAPDMGADEYAITALANDAGLSNYDTSITVCDNALKPFIIKLYNNGSAALTAAVISWKIDQAVQTPYNWNGSLLPGKYTFVNLGTYSTHLNAKKITAYLVEANQVSEVNKRNDSCVYENSLKVSLTGNYTIAGTGADFKSITAASVYLSKYGVCGAVTFTIKKGTYYEKAVFDSIPGASAVNTITFQSETTNFNDVRIENIDPYGIGPANFVNARHLNFKYIAIISTYFGPISFSNSKYIHFDNVRFAGTSTMITSESSSDYKLSFTNCLFECQVKLYTRPNSPNKKGLVVKGCTFTAENGLNLTNVDSVVISNNKFICGGSPQGYNTAINVAKGHEVEITKNYIKGQYSYGIVVDGDGSSSQPTLIANNVVIGGHLLNSQLIKLSYTKSLICTYNTCIANDVIADIPLAISYSNVDLHLSNNIFSNYGVGPAANIVTGAVGSTYSLSDHNVFYSKTANQITTSPAVEQTLADYKAATGLELHSLFSDPQFLPAPQFRFLNDTIRSIGIPVAQVTDDFENKPRNLTNPSPGAFESRPDTVYDYIHKDLQVLTMNDTLLTGDNVISVSLKSNLFKEVNSYAKHTGNIDVIDVSYKLNENAWVNEQWTGQLAMNQTLNYNFSKKLQIEKGKLFKLSVKAKIHSASLIDVNPANDSLGINLIVPMNGAYTVGGDQPDFANAEDAMTSLKICGEQRAVTFLFRPGTYNMMNIEGTDTLTLKSESGNAYDAKINCSRIHASNLAFKKITIFCHTNTVGDVYEERRLEILTNKLTIDSSVVTRNTNDPNGTPYEGLSFLTSSNVTITHTEFTNLWMGVIYNPIRNVNGATGNWGGKHEISNNTFTNCIGMFMIQAHSLATNGDITPADSIHFHDNSVSWGGSSININTNTNVFMKVYNNRASLFLGNTQSAIPIYNNFLSKVALYRTSNHQFINNSVNGLLEMAVCSNLTLKNNSFYNNQDVVMYFDDSCTFTSDYNNYYSTGNLFIQLLHKKTGTISFIKNLDSLKALTLQDQHSISVNPYYLSFSDLHSNSIHLKHKGAPVSFIKTDIDGQPRNATTPDIGADEIDLTADVVWPGDANADSKVTNQDLLSIGLYEGTNGVSRAAVLNDWSAQQSADWTQLQYNMVNMKHADCNGDGKVDANDTLAIKQNFNLVHNTNKKSASPDEVTLVGNDLYFVIRNPKTTFDPIEKIDVEVWLGKPTSTVNDVYGISFDVSILKRGLVNGTFNMRLNDSWLGNFSKISRNAYSFAAKDESNGIGYAAIVRNNHQNVSGYGKIASFSFTYTGASSAENLFLNFENVQLINANGNKLTVTPHHNSVTKYVGEVITDVPSSSPITGLITIAPNPFSDHTQIMYTLHKDEFIKLEIYNSLGQAVYTVLSEKQNAGMHTVEFNAKDATLMNGIYFIKLSNGVNTTINKIVVTE